MQQSPSRCGIALIALSEPRSAFLAGKVDKMDTIKRGKAIDEKVRTMANVEKFGAEIEIESEFLGTR